MTQFSTGAESLAPITISVAEAAKATGLSTWVMYQLTSGDNPEIEVRYKGTRKLVVVKSLLDYINNLPTTRPEPESA